jgi:hypothetical protein
MMLDIAALIGYIPAFPSNKTWVHDTCTRLHLFIGGVFAPGSTIACSTHACMFLLPTHLIY